jgi:hypothetical protein
MMNFTVSIKATILQGNQRTKSLPEAFSQRNRDKTFAYNAIPNIYIAEGTLE